MFDYKISKHPHFDEACRAFALRHNMAKLAERSGMNVQTLRNKLNPDQPHQLNAPDIWLLTDLTEDSTLVDGFLAQIHCLPCVPINEVAKEKLPHYVMSATAEIGRVAAGAVTGALKRTSLIWSWMTLTEKSCCRAVVRLLRWRWAGRGSRFSRKGHSQWTRLNTLAHRTA
ncbi:phage regulatory protein CII [Escherichia coli]|uniref:Phage regulatory protein CII n=2 Tax=Escherichia coli TaxID=562 RepID=A0A377C539_ECOLX|nr:phage regulatory protein CII [Escherichia coli]